MNSLFAIAAITIRNTIRSRVVLCLLCLLVLFVFGLPLTIRGDGTLEGLVSIHLRYTLGFSVFLLSMVTVWAGCAAISTEIRNGQMHLLTTKPVRRSQIWLGKWMGLTALNAFLLAFTAVCAYGMLAWTTRPAVFTDAERRTLREDILVAHRYLSPVDADLRDTARRQFDLLAERDALPEDLTRVEILRALENQIRRQAYSIPKGEARRWVFRVTHPPPEDRDLYLQYRYSSSRLDLRPVPGRWRIAPLDGPGILVEHTETPPRTTATIAVPADLVDANGYLLVEFTNTSPSPVTVIFEPDRGLHLLVYESSFEMNLVRCLLTLLTQLAFLSAVGITAGAFFSFPVAALASLYVVMLLHAGRIVAGMAERESILALNEAAGPAWIFVDRALLLFYRGLYRILHPLEMMDPLEFLTRGRLIPWPDIGEAVIIRILLYGGMIALLGAWHLRRRELGLPDD